VNKSTIIVISIILGTLLGVFAGVHQARQEANSSPSSSFPTTPSDTDQTEAGDSQADSVVSIPSGSSNSSADQVSTQVDGSRRPDSASSTSGAQVSRDGLGRIQVEVSEAEINQLVQKAIADHAHRSPLLANANDFSLRVRNGTIEGGASMRLSDIPTERLGERERSAIEGVTRVIPGLGNREIYVGVAGRPRAENGVVILGDDLTLKLGRLNLPFSQISNQLGVPVESLEREINRELQSKGIQIQDIEFVGDRVILRGDLR
jgi:hypothetical protein